MVEIYSYDITTSERFARDQQDVEAFRQQFHVSTSGARVVALQMGALYFVPRQSAESLLFQTYQKKTYARFELPKNFHTLHFLPSKIGSGLGPQERQEADILKIEAILKRDEQHLTLAAGEAPPPSDETSVAIHEEGELIIHFIEKGLIEPNQLIDEIRNRMLEFLQA